MKFQILIPVTLVFLLTASCSEELGPLKDPYFPNAIPESNYCTLNATFANPITVDGNARYQKRLMDSSGLGAISGTTFPIRKAEVVVLDSNDSIVQCTETDVSGNYSFTLPNDGETYKVKINSRSFNSDNKTSVLIDPNSNNTYFISQTFTADSTKTLPNLIASASDANLVAGAFNILDQSYRANEFLLNHAGSFTVTHKVQMYWKKGFNPISYFGGDTDSGVSFYLPDYNKLFILGGINGDVATTDTDHFDDAVIIHEYGHFIENMYFASDSQGGAHSGNSVIDPRLAWSEGFSNFFASAVTGDPIYRDTYGHSGGSTGYGFYYDIENDENRVGNPMDTPTASGEGTFRELAVARFLWDAIDPHPDSGVDDDNDGVQMPFSEMWSILTNQFKTGTPFREISLFLQYQADHGSTDISPLLSRSEMLMDATRAHYGTVRNPSSTDCVWTIQASAKTGTTGTTFQRSNQFHSNDFYYHYHPGGNLSATLNYDNSYADLDLYIYKNGYTFGYGDDIQIYSNKERPIDGGVEFVNGSAPAGHYMVNVMYFNDGAGSPATTYTLSIGGNNICK